MMRSAQSGNDKAELIRGGQQRGTSPSARKDTFDSSATLLPQYDALPYIAHGREGGGNFGRVGGVGGNTSTVGDIIKVHP